MKLNLSIKRRVGNQTILSTQLFEETLEWLKERNYIVQLFAKSKQPKAPTVIYEEYLERAINSVENGYRLTLLMLKWHKEELKKSLKPPKTDRLFFTE